MYFSNFPLSFFTHNSIVTKTEDLTNCWTSSNLLSRPCCHRDGDLVSALPCCSFYSQELCTTSLVYERKASRRHPPRKSFTSLCRIYPNLNQERLSYLNFSPLLLLAIASRNRILEAEAQQQLAKRYSGRWGRLAGRKAIRNQLTWWFQGFQNEKYEINQKC